MPIPSHRRPLHGWRSHVYACSFGTRQGTSGHWLADGDSVPCARAVGLCGGGRRRGLRIGLRRPVQHRTADHRAGIDRLWLLEDQERIGGRERRDDSAHDRHRKPRARWSHAPCWRAPAHRRPAWGRDQAWRSAWPAAGGFDTSGKSPLSPMARDVGPRQRKSLCILAGYVSVWVMPAKGAAG
jgi:hypothetical protein